MIEYFENLAYLIIYVTLQQCDNVSNASTEVVVHSQKLY